jgi:hypothetical protein
VLLNGQARSHDVITRHGTLQGLVRSLGLREARYKSLAAIAAEQVGRLKLNGKIGGVRR